MAPKTSLPGLMAQTELLWIPQDAEKLKSPSHKRAIFSHVQSNHGAQKRRAAAKASRASALQGRTSTLKDSSLRKIAQKESQADVARRRDTSAWPQSCDDETEEQRVSDESWDQSSSAVSPLSLLKEGNSDPFHAYAIAIGPEENKLITLYRDYIIPSVYQLNVKHKNINDKNMGELANRDWRDNVAGLEEKGAALATLARFGAMAGRTNPDMKQVTLRLLGQSTRFLRDKLFERQGFDKSVDCLHMNMLFNAEIINQNVVGAVAHGKMFLHIFKLQVNEKRLDYKLLLYQLHNDLQLSSTFLVRPVLDVGDFLPKVLKPLWDAASPYFPASSDEDEELDPAIEHEVLIHWFKQRGRMIRYEALSVGGVKAPPLPLVATSFMAYSFLFHSRMINLYLDTEDELQQNGLSDEIKSGLYARQCLALASAQLRKWTGYSPEIMGVLIYDNHRFMNAQKHALEQCEATSAGMTVDKYENARLWALYIGALVERGSVLDQTRKSQQWFNRKLAEVALRRGILVWNDLKIVLKGFLYEDSLMSQGSGWFEELVLGFRQESEQQPTTEISAMSQWQKNRLLSAWF